MKERKVNIPHKTEPKAAKARQEVVKVFMQEAAGARKGVQQVFCEAAVDFVRKTIKMDQKKTNY